MRPFEVFPGWIKKHNKQTNKPKKQPKGSEFMHVTYLIAF